jgi:3',5'-cyclic AMP phosphodiesterase CpdA
VVIAHVSDPHFGRIADEAVVDALVGDVNGLAPDLVAVSGDLTQRARRAEFEAARAMLDAFAAPVLVVPGNHDTHPWWRPIRRLRAPLSRYRTYITRDLTPTFEREGVCVLGVNTAFGATVKGGRIDRETMAEIERVFTTQPGDAFKVLVLHHHLAKIGALRPHDITYRARKALKLASAVGVDLILCGHLHISHVEPMPLRTQGRRLVIASAGTATSDRGRREHRATNFYNVVRLDTDAGAFEIEERRYVPRAGGFTRHRTSAFERERA